MNELQTFTYNDTPIRTVEHDGDTWWVLKDVCGVLHIVNHKNVSARLDDDEKQVVRLMDPIGNEQPTTIINESGLYNVILRSDKPEAKDFKRWVTHEVLPSIRRTGSYVAPSMSTNELVLMMAQNNVQMEKDIKALQAQTATLTAKVDGVTKALTHPDTIGSWKVDMEMAIREMSKSINFRGRLFCELETKAGCNLNSRLTRTRNRARKNGMTLAQSKAINKLDLIAADKRLRNIFDAIIREHQAAAVVGIPQQEVIDAEFSEVI